MYIGIDIGGTSVKAVLVKNQKIIRSQAANLPKNLAGLLNLLQKILKEFSAAAGKNQIKGVGVSVPGPLDLKREKVLSSPNIKYLNNQPLKKLLEQKFKLPVALEHDVHAFLLAEKEMGLARNLKNVFYLTLGTGVGGAFMIDGKIIKGSHGASGEVGHMILEMSKKSDFEDLGANKFVKKLLGVDVKKAAGMAKFGDLKTEKVFLELGRNIGVGIANIINIFDPEAVILSGGLINLKKYLTSGIKEGIEKFVISPSAKKTKIIFSKLGVFGGALGATLLFRKA